MDRVDPVQCTYFILERTLKGLDWIHLALEKNRWRSHVDTVMDLWCHKTRGISLLTERLSAVQEGLVRGVVTTGRQIILGYANVF